MNHLFDVFEQKLISKDVDVYPWLGFDHDSGEHSGVVPIQNYPYVRGRSHEDVVRLTTETIIDVQDLALFQSWLFFGVLETVLQRHVPSVAFLQRHETHGWVLDSSPLRSILGDLKEDLLEERRHDVPFMRRFAASLDEALRFSASFNRLLITQVQVAAELKTVYESVVQSSALLAESLYALHEFLLEDDFAAFPDLQWLMTPDTDRLFHERLVKRGWCPSVQPMAKTLGLSMLQYAVAHEREGFAPRTSHEGCSTTSCKIIDVDLSSYSPAHTADCTEQNCRMITAELEDLDACLEAGTFPIVDATELFYSKSVPKSTECLPVIPYMPGLPFVAISHVWAHGRGSIAETGLPTCQLENLVRIALTPTQDLGTFVPYLWIDSLCVPEDPELRGTAIELMSSVYSAAKVTIVLDDGMQTTSAASTDHFLLRLMLSDWNRRLWTLQEALLSQDVQILTPTGLVSLKRRLAASLRNPVRTAVSLRISTFFISFISATHRSTRMFALLLKDRSSSKSSDEALAIAPLFGVDTKHLISLTGDDRVAALWRSVGSVPRGLMFMGSRDHLSTAGMRWAPKSLMAPDSFMDTTDVADNAHVTDHGLEAVFFVLRFKNKVVLSGGDTALVAHDTINNLYYLVNKTADTADAGTTEVFADAIILLRDLRRQPGEYEAVASAISQNNNEKAIGEAGLPVFNYVDRRTATVAHAEDFLGRLPEGVQLADIVDVECEPLEELQILVS